MLCVLLFSFTHDAELLEERAVGRDLFEAFLEEGLQEARLLPLGLQRHPLLSFRIT